MRDGIRDKRDILIKLAFCIVFLYLPLRRLLGPARPDPKSQSFQRARLVGEDALLCGKCSDRSLSRTRYPQGTTAARTLRGQVLSCSTHSTLAPARGGWQVLCWHTMIRRLGKKEGAGAPLAKSFSQ